MEAKIKESKDFGGNAKGLRKIIQSGSKDLVPKKFSNIATSGSFKNWPREIKDFARMADPMTNKLFTQGEISEKNPHASVK